MSVFHAVDEITVQTLCHNSSIQRSTSQHVAGYAYLMQSCQTFTLFNCDLPQIFPFSPLSLVAVSLRWLWKPTWTWTKTLKRRSSSIWAWRSTSPQSSSSGTPTKTWGYWWPAVWLTSSGSMLPRLPTRPTTNSRLGTEPGWLSEIYHQTTKHCPQGNSIVAVQASQFWSLHQLKWDFMHIFWAVVNYQGHKHNKNKVILSRYKMLYHFT